MGNGLVLESGTHAELLLDENGPYARLVHAQKLRESEVKQHESDAGSSTQDAEKNADEETDAETIDNPDLGLSRIQSKRSLASEVLEQRRASQQGEKTYSLPYLFMRMGKINRDQWPRYMVGTIAAFSKELIVLPFSLLTCFAQ